MYLKGKKIQLVGIQDGEKNFYSKLFTAPKSSNVISEHLRLEVLKNAERKPQ